MKHLWKVLSLSAAICLAETGCKTIEDIPDSDDFQTVEILASLNETKTVNEGTTTKWVEGDQVHVWHKLNGASDYTDDGMAYITDTETGRFTVTLAEPLQSGSTYDWKVIYSVEKGNTWMPVQNGNDSSEHLCGPLCPLEGHAEGLSANATVRVPMTNTMSVAKFVVTNSLEHPLNVTTVAVGDYKLRVEGSEPIEKGNSATFYLPLEPFQNTSGTPLDISVDGFTKTVTTALSFTAGKQKTINFNYNNPDKTPYGSVIYSSARYSSFPDIVHHKDRYYVAFREAGGHVSYNVSEKGEIKIYSSTDGNTWEQESKVIISTGDYDLRDPHFVESLDGERLLLYYGRAICTSSADDSDRYFPVDGCSEVAELRVGSKGKLNLDEGSKHVVNIGSKSRYWLWSVTKHDDAYYGVAYYSSGYPVFVKSTDGVNYTEVSEIHLSGNESSTTFIGDKAYVFLRSVQTNDAFVANAEPPYTNWSTKTFYATKQESPVAITLWDIILVCMRGNSGVPVNVYSPLERTYSQIDDVFQDPNADRGYPGMIVYDDALHIVYYGDLAGSKYIYYRRYPLEAIYESVCGAQSSADGNETSIEQFEESGDVLYL